VVGGALIRLAYELIVLIGPSEFRDAQYYVLGALGVGLIFYIVAWLNRDYQIRVDAARRYAVSRGSGPPG